MYYQNVNLRFHFYVTDTHSGNQVLAVKRMMDKIVKGNWKWTSILPGNFWFGSSVREWTKSAEEENSWNMGF